MGRLSLSSPDLGPVSPGPPPTRRPGDCSPTEVSWVPQEPPKSGGGPLSPMTPESLRPPVTQLEGPDRIPPATLTRRFPCAVRPPPRPPSKTRVTTLVRWRWSRPITSRLYLDWVPTVFRPLSYGPGRRVEPSEESSAFLGRWTKGRSVPGEEDRDRTTSRRTDDGKTRDGEAQRFQVPPSSLLSVQVRSLHRARVWSLFREDLPCTSVDRIAQDPRLIWMTDDSPKSRDE